MIHNVIFSCSAAHNEPADTECPQQSALTCKPCCVVNNDHSEKLRPSHSDSFVEQQKEMRCSFICLYLCWLTLHYFVLHCIFLVLAFRSCEILRRLLCCAAGYLLGGPFTEHLEEAVSRSQQVRGVQQEASEEQWADIRLDSWEQCSQLQGQARETATDEVKFLRGGLENTHRRKHDMMKETSHDHLRCGEDLIRLLLEMHLHMAYSKPETHAPGQVSWSLAGGN